MNKETEMRFRISKGLRTEIVKAALAAGMTQSEYLITLAIEKGIVENGFHLDDKEPDDFLSVQAKYGLTDQETKQWLIARAKLKGYRVAGIPETNGNPTFYKVSQRARSKKAN